MHDIYPPALERKAARIAPQEDGSFAYDRSGSLALAVEDRHGDMADVVAWGRDPLKWWLRHGDQTPILIGEVAAHIVERLRRRRARAAT